MERGKKDVKKIGGNEEGSQKNKDNYKEKRI